MHKNGFERNKSAKKMLAEANPSIYFTVQDQQKKIYFPIFCVLLRKWIWRGKTFAQFSFVFFSFVTKKLKHRNALRKQNFFCIIERELKNETFDYAFVKMLVP